MEAEAIRRRPHTNNARAAARATALAAGAALASSVLLATAGCGSLRLGNIEPPPGQRIVSTVHVRGAHALDEDDIIDRLATRPEVLDPTVPKVLLDRAELARDLRRIEAFYAAHGYFAAQALPASVRAGDGGTVHVVFTVREGPATRVSAVTFDLPRRPPRDPEARRRVTDLRGRLPEVVPIRAGAIWTEHAHEEAKETITRALLAEGFAFAHVGGDVVVDRAAHTATVRYLLAPGPRVRIASIRVHGNRRVSTALIRQRIELGPGDTPTPEALADARDRVLSLGVFASARVALRRKRLGEALEGAPPTIDNVRAIAWPSEVPLDVYVQESAFRELQAGVGATADTSRVDILLGRLGYVDRDLLGGLQRLDLGADPALVALLNDGGAVRLDFGMRATAGFQWPRFLEEYTTLSLHGTYDRLVDLAYDTDRVRGSWGLGRIFGPHLTIQLLHSLEYYALDSSAGTSTSGTPAVADPDCTSCELHGAAAIDLLGLGIRSTYLLSSLEPRLTLDLRDNPLDARRGLYASASAALSLPAVGSDFSYLRLLGDVRGYVTPWRFLTVAARLKVGALLSFGGATPLPARFRGGGADEMRGAITNGLGPYLCRRADGSVFDDARGLGCEAPSYQRDGEATPTPLPVGGALLALASVETRWYLTRSFAFVAFFDVGQVWAALTDFSLDTLRLAPGVGVRLYTPIGPLRFDLGLALGQADAPLVPHLSLGQSF